MHSLTTTTKTAGAILRRRLKRSRIRGATGQDAFKVLALTSDNPISAAQIFPFYFYADELWRDHRISFVEVSERDFFLNPGAYKRPFDAVIYQPWFTVGAEQMVRQLSVIRDRYPDARVIFFDSYAPTDLRFASVANPYIDVYLKKHLFSNRDEYHKPTCGDTNLVEYYSRLYGLSCEETFFDIPAGFPDKLTVGPTFFTGHYLLPVFHDARPSFSQNRGIDVHGRLAFDDGEGWYGRMRRHSLTQLTEIIGISTVTGIGIKRRQFMWELRNSKICFSPFGYGECCWRDYEAAATGSLLIKPDMSHMQTAPDIFKPFETYVPVKWDFSDLEERVRHYLDAEEERKAIVERAFQVLHDYAVNNGFSDQMGSILLT